ncbi:hypothetical protein TorRG33x02_043720 [Trema orientale]|uniref:Retroviral polymerase SH3-like domain-containing protein n=1 Tax=Trema orientale TaxID=63057 RepID=A0A2P5FQ84_TREOI|nr:hypothetical protein TorRG33x02_043720 [Trema orientale]
MKIFECPAYAHIDNRKLEPRSMKCIFLCYKAGVKGYKLWCPETRKIIMSRDIIFDESHLLRDLPIRDSSSKHQQKSNIQQGLLDLHHFETKRLAPADYPHRPHSWYHN